MRDFSGDLVFFSFLRLGFTDVVVGSVSSSSLDMTSALAFRFGGTGEAAGVEVTVDDAGFLDTEKKERIS